MSTDHEIFNFDDADNERLIALLALFDAIGDDFSLPLMRALLKVALKPGLSINELADALEVPQQTASRYAAILLGRYETPLTNVSLALVEQGVNPEEPRKRSLYITTAGVERLKKITDLIPTLGNK